MRKTLTQALLAAFCAILARGTSAAHVEGGGVMQIASRVSMWSGARTPTAKDYVQNGLVAMWDGIENAGWGVHDASATTWQDLIGSADISVPQLTSFYWGANHLHRGNDGGDLLSAIAVEKDTTIQICCTLSDQNIASNNPRIVGWYIPGAATGARMEVDGLASDLTRAPRVYLKYESSTTSSVIYGRFGRASPWGVWCESYIFDADGHFSIIDTSEGSAAQLGPTTSPVDVGYYASSRLHIGGRASVATTLAIMDIYSVRHYSRALTASEIARNYAIDKERFGLT